jgi:hypothetical protein
VKMDLMVAEEARVSTDSKKEDNLPKVNSDAEGGPISDTDTKFQRVISAWRSTYRSGSWPA